MPFCPSRSLHPLLIAIAATFLAVLGAGTARADLVWTAETGWIIEGGALSGLSGNEARNALEAMNAARRNEEARRYNTAARAYTRIADRYPNSVYSAEALFRAGRNFTLKKQYFKGFAAYQKMVAYYPNSSRFTEAVGEQYRIATALLDGARNHILRGLIPSFRSTEQAIAFFETVLQNGPALDYAAPALMSISRGYDKLNQIENSIDALDRLINFHPQSLLAPDAYLKLGKLYASLATGPDYDQTATRDAITFLSDFIIQYPNDPGVPEAERNLGLMRKEMADSKMKMADFYFYKRSNFVAARVFYNEAITAYPDSEVATLARARLREVELKAGTRPEDDPSAGTAQPTSAAPAPRKKRFWLF